jgi:hypothetical protein
VKHDQATKVPRKLYEEDLRRLQAELVKIHIASRLTEESA